MGHRERRERSEFLTRKEIEAMYFDEFEAEISKNCATEFDKRLKYVFEVPEILEKAWKMPFREDKEAYLRPVVCLAGLENLDECSEKSNDTCVAILEAQGWFLRNKSFEKKDWRDFK